MKNLDSFGILETSAAGTPPYKVYSFSKLLFNNDFAPKTELFGSCDPPRITQLVPTKQ